jgi:hypothetical protein
MIAAMLLESSSNRLISICSRLRAWEHCANLGCSSDDPMIFLCEMMHRLANFREYLRLVMIECLIIADSAIQAPYLASE